MTSMETTGTNLTPKPVPTSGGLTLDEVENYWIQAGGNPQAAAMAAAVADASSGLNPGTSRTNPDGTTSVGLWLIPKNGTPPGTSDPLSNARAAVQLSNNGTDWSQWCVTWSDNNCGVNGGTYLGQGANALGALGSAQSSYNVIGSSPSGSGTGASTATSKSTSTTAGGSKSPLLIIVLVIVIVLGYLWWRGRNRQQPSEGVSNEPQ